MAAQSICLEGAMSCYVPSCKNEAVNRCCESDHFMCEEHTSVRGCSQTGRAICVNCAAEGHRHAPALVATLLAFDEGLQQPFRIKFKYQTLLYSRIAELWIHGAEFWIKEADAVHLKLPISGTLTSADGRTITLGTLE